MLLLVLVYFVYLFLGATVFSAIEHPIERRMLKDLEDQKDEFLRKHECIKGQNFKTLLLESWMGVCFFFIYTTLLLRPTHK